MNLTRRTHGDGFEIYVISQLFCQLNVRMFPIASEKNERGLDYHGEDIKANKGKTKKNYAD